MLVVVDAFISSGALLCRRSFLLLSVPSNLLHSGSVIGFWVEQRSTFAHIVEYLDLFHNITRECRCLLHIVVGLI